MHSVLPLGVVTAVDGGTDVVAKGVSGEGVVSSVVSIRIQELIKIVHDLIKV